VKELSFLKMKVAIISINIGDYSVFWRDFYVSSKQNFMVDCDKEYFVFSDSTEIEYFRDDVHLIHVEDMGWPFNTMKRWHLFNQLKKYDSKFDFFFFINANAVFQDVLTSEIIKNNKRIITVEHPGTHGKKIEKIPWERRPESGACVPHELGKTYVQGAFLGARTDAFFEMSEELAKQTDIDIKKGIIAIYHDESFLNKYIIGRDDVQILGWQYLKYECMVYPYKPVILLREKRKYLKNNNGRYLNEWYLPFYLKLAMRNIKWVFLIKTGIMKKTSIYDQEGRYINNDISDTLL
jgi:hypothetical protein